MVLAIHSDASYLSEPRARSRAGGHFFLSENDQDPRDNGAVHTVAKIIKAVMSSAAEAELGHYDRVLVQYSDYNNSYRNTVRA